MIRISKTTQNIESITLCEKNDSKNSIKIDSFIIMPGVTTYNNIYSIEKNLFFDGIDSYIVIDFNNESNLDRFFIQLLREIKLNQVTNVNIDSIK
jgi:hypothetical protein